MKHKFNGCKTLKGKITKDSVVIPFEAESYSIEISHVTIDELAELDWSDIVKASTMKIKGQIKCKLGKIKRLKKVMKRGD